MEDGMDPLIAHVIGKYGISALAVLGALVVLANRMGWLSVRLPSLSKRQDDKVLEQLITIVKENTAAFQALKSTMEDNKGITIQVANTLNQVQNALATLSGQVMVRLKGHEGRAHSPQGG